MNETIELMLNHRSIRKFTGQAVSEEQLHTIITAAQMASSSSHVQAYSVIRVSDPDKREKLVELTMNQRHVADSPLFLVWCADLYRNRLAYSLHDDPNHAYLSTAENMIVATVDAALAGQNAALAAESMGMGIVYIGGIRNEIRAVTELLELPEWVYPVFGMCIGYPDQEVGIKPRLPMEAILHYDKYDISQMSGLLESYDHTMSEYMLQRTKGKVNRTWTEDMKNKFASPSRMHMKAYLEEQGFNLQ
ncbi:MAG: oxygen-insensitive NADPH nitroreductase [Paenibacillaceae bacterium]